MTVDFYKFEDMEAPIIQAKVGGIPLNLLVDTGSDSGFIDVSHMNDMQYTDTHVRVGGIVGVTQDSIYRTIYRTCIDINGNKYPWEFIFNDLKQSFDEIFNTRGVRIHGAIGSTFLKEYGFILDFDKLAMYTQR